MQTLYDHSRNVAQYASLAGERIGLGRLLYLCGLLHDLGKASDAFQTYLSAGERSQRGSVLHAAQGAVYARSRWYQPDTASRLTADLIAVAISSHHGKLPDLLNQAGDSFFEKTLFPTRFATVEERAPEPLPALLSRFYAQVAGEADLDALFLAAKQEVEQVYKARVAPALWDIKSKGPLQESNTRDGLLGLLQRDVFSALIDADRLDAYRFEALEPAGASAQPPWDDWIANLETKLGSFDQASPIARLRAAISAECLRHAEEGAGAGIYRLCVPTGGGKTFSAMRYALAVAKARGMRRIVYAAPYKAILEQTAAELRDALGHEEQILEHHSDVTFAPEAENGTPDGRQETDALKRYQALTERWDSHSPCDYAALFPRQPLVNLYRPGYRVDSASVTYRPFCWR